MQVHKECTVRTALCQKEAKVTLTSEKIKPAIIELHLSEGITQSAPQLVSQQKLLLILLQQLTC